MKPAAKKEPTESVREDVVKQSRLAKLASDETLRVSLLGAVLMWAALPPLGIGALGWIAPVPWLWLARQREMSGRHPYRALWFSSLVFWLAATHWLRLPHWATSFGWVALSVYLACYTPLVVALARVAERRLGVGIVLSAPILWTACDQARAYVFTGFSMASLCHSQYRWTSMIQAADLCGEFGVTFLMVLVAAAVARALPMRETKASWHWLTVAVGVMVLMFGYGEWRLGDVAARTKPGPKIALIQGSIDTEFKYDPAAPPKIHEHYMDLSKRAVAAEPDVQLVVWPETMFPFSTLSWSDDAEPGPDDTWLMEDVRNAGPIYQEWIASTAETLRKPLLIGIDATRFVKGRAMRWNAALYTDARGNALGRYDKRHPVLFGEYTPFAKTLPFLYALTPLTGGIEEGERAEAFDLAGTKLVPSICYETVLARLIRRQVIELRERGIEPDVLVNVTNDGWYWGTSELDMHMIFGVFRAVESRKPLVIAANTGFSAQIDADGRIVRQGPRREAGFINAAVLLDLRRSPYLAWGDWLANGCLICLGLVSAVALYYRGKKTV
ncbi:MAG: apolipoprotein N-acyltransferase [Planctomycetia bacterium]|nr:apolipoprotein N-acyltransferase [Planctomycetia bacterium]